jgi:hypothetical protein
MIDRIAPFAIVRLTSLRERTAPKRSDMLDISMMFGITPFRPARTMPWREFFVITVMVVKS